jgi:hypothetical protein
MAAMANAAAMAASAQRARARKRGILKRIQKRGSGALEEVVKKP